MGARKYRGSREPWPTITPPISLPIYRCQTSWTVLRVECEVDFVELLRLSCVQIVCHVYLNHGSGLSEQMSALVEEVLNVADARIMWMSLTKTLGRTHSCPLIISTIAVYSAPSRLPTQKRSQLNLDQTEWS